MTTPEAGAEPTELPTPPDPAEFSTRPEAAETLAQAANLGKNGPGLWRKRSNVFLDGRGLGSG